MGKNYIVLLLRTLYEKLTEDLEKEIDLSKVFKSIEVAELANSYNFDVNLAFSI